MGLLCQHDQCVEFTLREASLSTAQVSSMYFPPPSLSCGLGGAVTQVSVHLAAGGTSRNLYLGWVCTETSCLVFRSSDTLKKIHCQELWLLDWDGIRQISLLIVVFGKRNWCCQIWVFWSLKNQGWIWGLFPQFRSCFLAFRPPIGADIAVWWILVPSPTVTCLRSLSPAYRGTINHCNCLSVRPFQSYLLYLAGQILTSLFKSFLLIIGDDNVFLHLSLFDTY